MSISIDAIELDRLADYANVPMVCDVKSIFAIDEIDGDEGGFSLLEEPVRAPYRKDYDASSEGGPLTWPRRFDLSHWKLWVAHDQSQIVGGAAVVWNSADFEILEGRNDLALLWDIRVRPTNQRNGVGAALFREAARWAKSNGCHVLKIETQNVNVAACRFYAKMGCVLSQIDRAAYRHCPEIADEVKLIWTLDLSTMDLPN